MSDTFWQGRPVLVTGGASFIGSHLTDALVALGAAVTVVDDLSSGDFRNIADHVAAGRIAFHHADLRVGGIADRLCAGIDTVFHLAATHGGRGFLDTHQAACAGNLVLDGLVFRAAVEQRVRKVVFASSGCVYPLSLQDDPGQETLLREEMVGPPYEPDGMYGWAKLMGELTLRSLHDEAGLEAVSCRYFTVYGPRGLENHAIIAMMARALAGQDPFVIWGDGTQVRNWTHVTDVVRGTILAAEKIHDATAINLGTSDRITVLEAARMVLNLAGRQPRIEFQPWMPIGPRNRAASNQLARDCLGWVPSIPFERGLRETYAWYVESRRGVDLGRNLDELLFARGTAVDPL